MSAIGRFLGLLLALLGLVLPAAGAGQGGEGAQGPEVPVYLFWSASCPHCLAARPQIQALAAAHPWIVLHDLELGADPAHGERYEAMAAELGEEIPAHRVAQVVAGEGRFAGELIHQLQRGLGPVGAGHRHRPV